MGIKNLVSEMEKEIHSLREELQRMKLEIEIKEKRINQLEKSVIRYKEMLGGGL